MRRSDAPEVQDALNRRLLASQMLNASCTKWDACMVKLFRNDWEESVVFLFSENRGFFFTLVIYLIIVIIYNFRILFTVVVCLLILLCYLSKSLFMSSLHGTPFTEQQNISIKVE